MTSPRSPRESGNHDEALSFPRRGGGEARARRRRHGRRPDRRGTWASERTGGGAGCGGRRRCARRCGEPAQARGQPLQETRLLSPARPRKYLAIALNYADHIAETGLEAPEVPTFFNKQSTCVVGPGAGIHKPKVSDRLDYEGELAVVIGRRCRHVPVERAHEVIAGYTIANDVSVRDWQMRAPTMTIGKSFDTHGPLGPWVVTGDELGDPQQLDIRTFVNDEKRQDGNTREMVFDCFEQVSHLSQAFTLEPGDTIATGTPAGIGAAVKPFPEGLLKVGDVVRIEIDGIGELRNEVIPSPTASSSQRATSPEPPPGGRRLRLRPRRGSRPSRDDREIGRGCPSPLPSRSSRSTLSTIFAGSRPLRVVLRRVAGRARAENPERQLPELLAMSPEEMAGVAAPPFHVLGELLGRPSLGCVGNEDLHTLDPTEGPWRAIRLAWI